MSDENKIEQSVADIIWNDIKDKPVEMFALAGQMVSDYCTPHPIDPSRCFLTYKASSVIPALEAVLGSKYSLELADKYAIISKAEKWPTKKV